MEEQENAEKEVGAVAVRRNERQCDAAEEAAEKAAEEAPAMHAYLRSCKLGPSTSPRLIGWFPLETLVRVAAPLDGAKERAGADCRGIGQPAPTRTRTDACVPDAAHRLPSRQGRKEAGQ